MSKLIDLITAKYNIMYHDYYSYIIYISSIPINQHTEYVLILQALRNFDSVITLRRSTEFASIIYIDVFIKFQRAQWQSYLYILTCYLAKLSISVLILISQYWYLASTTVECDTSRNFSYCNLKQHNACQTSQI